MELLKLFKIAYKTNIFDFVDLFLFNNNFIGRTQRCPDSNNIKP